MELLQKKDSNIELKKQQIRKDVTTILTKLEHKNISLEKIGTVSQHIKIAKEILNIDDENKTSKFPILEAAVKEPTNKKISKQSTFHSTKKRKRKNTGIFRKPNEEEKSVIDGLLHDHNY